LNIERTPADGKAAAFGLRLTSSLPQHKEKAMAERNPDDRESRRNPSSPYGPQPTSIDEAAGGADSSPFETVPPEDRPEAKREVADQRASDPKNA
jgi:hypothetical protein